MSNHSSTLSSGRRGRRRQLVMASVLGLTAGVLATASSAAAEDSPPVGHDQYIAQYADGTFSRGGTELKVAPGLVDDQGVISEVLTASVHQQSCQGRFLITVDASGSSEAADLEGVVVDARGGSAAVSATLTLTGDVTITPAGRRCESPNDAAATTAPLTTDVTIDATWTNLRGSVPVVYGGAECGGDGVCYYRDATAKASWSSDFIGEFGSTKSPSGFFFEGTYSAGTAALAQIPSA
jgi:hypothetical protein